MVKSILALSMTGLLSLPAVVFSSNITQTEEVAPKGASYYYVDNKENLYEIKFINGGMKGLTVDSGNHKGDPKHGTLNPNGRVDAGSQLKVELPNFPTVQCIVETPKDRWDAHAKTSVCQLDADQRLKVVVEMTSGFMFTYHINNYTFSIE